MTNFYASDRFIELCDERSRTLAARKYTIVLDGVECNKGEFRDNLFDVLEELADAFNIARIGFKRLVEATASWSPLDKGPLIGSYLELYEHLLRAADLAEEIRVLQPEDLSFDHQDVVGPIERIGYPAWDVRPTDG